MREFIIIIKVLIVLRAGLLPIVVQILKYSPIIFLCHYCELTGGPIRWILRREKASMTMADYRKRAEECIEIAQTARTPAQRTMLLHIAETWLNLARDVEGYPLSTTEQELPEASKL